MKRLAPSQPCPCGATTVAMGGGAKLAAKKVAPWAYGQCCGRWLEAGPQNGPFAPDAQQLMRSRYTAFVLEREAYLLATWHPGHRPPHIEFDLGVKWLGLEVRDCCSTGADTAEVEFVARHKPNRGPAIRLHERSRFVRNDDRWLYLDGTQL